MCKHRVFPALIYSEICTRQTLTYLKSTMKAVEKDAKYVQS